MSQTIENSVRVKATKMQLDPSGHKTKCDDIPEIREIEQNYISVQHRDTNIGYMG